MGSKRNAENAHAQKENKRVYNENRNSRKATLRTPSLKTLINWNISKVLKSDPRIDLRAALREAHERLESARDMEALVCPEAHNLSCAVLAWQQLGHRDADSLFNFVQQALKEESGRNQSVESIRESVSWEMENPCRPAARYSEEKDSIRSACQWGAPAKMDFSTSIGLVVKLPSEPQTLMHLSGPVRVPRKANKCSKPCATMNKIDSACCLDAACMDQLKSIEAQTQELRRRAGHFANREAERAELLERAEMAWRDLDRGYQRRLKNAKEKEEDYEKQTARMLEERNRYKSACMPLVSVLMKKSALAEKEQENLQKLEQSLRSDSETRAQEVCAKACARLQLAEQDSHIDAQLTEYQCKASQLDRNLAMKEEQEKRKQRSLAGEAEAAQVLAHEAEYAQRSELEALRAQVQQASQDLLEEDGRTKLLKKRIEDYIEEKDEMIEDLEACQTKCDGRMAGLSNDLKSKREKIAELKLKVMECLCKEPVDRAVEVRRTPSLAALCRCSPSEMIHGTCSCTSVRNRLLSSLLKDLFGGLKSEMESIGSQMPCHLLKCLEDKHNWDRSTDVKTNVRNYFSRLLLGELDIAIATVIEKCHAQWVGECCADLRKPAMADSRHSLRWQEHELEMKTQKMATKLAEKMFLEKAKELAKEAEQNLNKDGHPPCECDLNAASDCTGKYSSAVYRCQVQTHPTKLKTAPTIASDNVHHKDKPISQLMPIGSVRKDANSTMHTLNPMGKNRKKDLNNLKPETTMKNNGNVGKPAATRRISNIVTRKRHKSVLPKGELNGVGNNASNRVFRGPQQYSVNMCFCDDTKKLTSTKSHERCQLETESSYNNTFSSPVSSLRQSSPIVLIFPEKNSIKERDVTNSSLCREIGPCFHKTPSNTSVDRLISILSKWKDNLVESQDSNIIKALSTDSLFKITHKSIINVLQQLGGKTESKNNINDIKKCLTTNKNTDSLEESARTDEKKVIKPIISIERQIQPSQPVQTLHLNDPLNEWRINVKELEQNTGPLHSIHSVKRVGMKVMSSDADIRQAPIKNHVAIENSIKLNNFVNTDNPTDKNKDAEVNCVEKLTAINNSQSCAIRNQEGEKCIQCLGVTLADVNKYAKLDNLTSKGSRFLLQIKGSFDKSGEIQKRRNQNNNEIGDTSKFLTINPNDNSENFIQFLGVTLDKAKDNLLTKHNGRTKKSYRNPQLDQMSDDKQMNNRNKSAEKRFTLNASRDLRKARFAYKRIKEVNILHVHNDCTYPHRKDTQLTENKSVEVQNTSNNIMSPEPCVCCPTSLTDSSNDLEINTFQLLEEHLKSQLEEFKNSACKSSCLQNNTIKQLQQEQRNKNKESLFSETLLKVKKLILESASSVTCKCVGDNQTNKNSGSWNRAYSLLQEYLRTKIEHVKCLCNSPDNNRDENLVPSVLSKISCLIDNDLQRLKDMCKCSDTKSEVVNKPELDFTHEPECFGEVKNCITTTTATTTDTNYLSTSQMVGSMLVGCNSNSSLPYDKSAQVLLQQSMLTKSCNALEICSDNNTQTVDILDPKFVIDGNNTEPDNDYRNTAMDDKDGSTQEDKNKTNLLLDVQDNEIIRDNTLFQKGDLDVTVLPIVMSSGVNIIKSDLKENAVTGHEPSTDDDKFVDLENVDEKFNEPFLPYVGCTINCSCDSDLGCVCTKSRLLTNNKLNDVWKTLTQKQRVFKNVSYILNNMASKIPEDVNSVVVTEDFQVTDVIQINNLNQCDSEIATIDEKMIYPNRHKKIMDGVNNYYQTELTQAIKTNLCDTEVSAREEKHVYLKKSTQSLDIVTSTSGTNTLIDYYSLQSFSLPLKTKHPGILKRNKSEFNKYTPICSGTSVTALMSDQDSRKSVCCSTDCDCAMVPICHVKMLMENIGNKLVKAECTCDSLKSVCPVHS